MSTQSNNNFNESVALNELLLLLLLPMMMMMM